jgi:cytochrome c biogenesis protein CcmG, thiol:disulfide interchange protein DsbE
MTLKWLRFMPILMILALIAVLWRGLYLNPKEIPSPLIDQPAPTFQLPNLLDPKTMIDNSVLSHKVTIVNVWASWCAACVEEQQFIRSIAPTTEAQWLGFNYKDDSKEALAWLQQYGNPYTYIAADATGQAALDWGIYGTPETFVIDKKGIIRYKHIGPISLQDWQKQFVPLLAKLNQEAA